jgi:hypothetical protein
MAKALETWKRLEEIHARLPNLVVTGTEELFVFGNKGLTKIDPLAIASAVARAKGDLLELSTSLKRKGRGKKNAG